MKWSFENPETHWDMLISNRLIECGVDKFSDKYCFGMMKIREELEKGGILILVERPAIDPFMAIAREEADCFGQFERMMNL